MAVNYIYKIEKGHEKGVLNKFFHDSKLKNCMMVGDAAGAMRAREYIASGKPKVKIFEFKKATYIKSEGVMNHTNIRQVRSVGD